MSSGHYVILEKKPTEKWSAVFGLFNSALSAQDYINSHCKEDYNYSISKATEEEIDKAIEIRMRNAGAFRGTEFLGRRE